MTWTIIVFALLIAWIAVFCILVGLMVGYRLRHDLPPVELPPNPLAKLPTDAKTTHVAERDEEAEQMVKLWQVKNEEGPRLDITA